MQLQKGGLSSLIYGLLLAVFIGAVMSVINKVKQNGSRTNQTNNKTIIGGKRMINEMNEKINKLNKKLGVNVKLPKMNSRRLNQSATINLIIGGGLTSAGVFFKRNELFILGSLGLLSSLVMSIEAKKIEDQSK
ncbi:hypothetical protein [Enterococcus crotali]|uniref:hypothetical protein n=1 Tax=Enterococcus crotali TaxID=1453587 RepID=UPI000FE147AF|nr:hypothetical protein [Enterococcus crotali]